MGLGDRVQYLFLCPSIAYHPSALGHEDMFGHRKTVYNETAELVNSLAVCVHTANSGRVFGSHVAFPTSLADINIKQP